MKKTLIVGYGNADRQDDGVAWHILVRAAGRLGIVAPDTPEESIFPEDRPVDLWFVLQLAPEMGEDFARYERVCFIDAHTGNIAEEILLQPADGSPAASAFTHHLTPAACLALTRSVYGKDPEAVLLSVRGYQFGFTRELSAETSALIEPALAVLWDWLENEDRRA